MTQYKIFYKFPNGKVISEKEYSNLPLLQKRQCEGFFGRQETNNYSKKWDWLFFMAMLVVIALGCIALVYAFYFYPLK